MQNSKNTVLDPCHNPIGSWVVAYELGYRRSQPMASYVSADDILFLSDGLECHFPAPSRYSVCT
jgi:hypothetical protein